MKILLYTSAIFLLNLLSSCGGNDEKTQTTYPTTLDANTLFPQTINNTAQGSQVELNPEHGQPGHRCDIPVGSPLNGSAASDQGQVTTTIPGNDNSAVTATSSQNSVPADGLNPKHGEPGHRCDIAVGAPLNSPSGITANTATENSTSASTIPDAKSVLPADGLNPKHGEPGHRCDIAVGAPLNSKPEQLP